MGKGSVVSWTSGSSRPSNFSGKDAMLGGFKRASKETEASAFVDGSAVSGSDASTGGSREENGNAPVRIAKDGKMIDTDPSPCTDARRRREGDRPGTTISSLSSSSSSSDDDGGGGGGRRDATGNVKPLTRKHLSIHEGMVSSPPHRGENRKKRRRGGGRWDDSGKRVEMSPSPQGDGRKERPLSSSSSSSSSSSGKKKRGGNHGLSHRRRRDRRHHRHEAWTSRGGGGGVSKAHHHRFKGIGHSRSPPWRRHQSSNSSSSSSGGSGSLSSSSSRSSSSSSSSSSGGGRHRYHSRSRSYAKAMKRRLAIQEQLDRIAFEEELCAMPENAGNPRRLEQIRSMDTISMRALLGYMRKNRRREYKIDGCANMINKGATFCEEIFPFVPVLNRVKLKGLSDNLTFNNGSMRDILTQINDEKPGGDGLPYVPPTAMLGCLLVDCITKTHIANTRAENAMREKKEAEEKAAREAAERAKQAEGQETQVPRQYRNRTVSTNLSVPKGTQETRNISTLTQGNANALSHPLFGRPSTNNNNNNRPTQGTVVVGSRGGRGGRGGSRGVGGGARSSGRSAMSPSPLPAIRVNSPSPPPPPPPQRQQQQQQQQGVSATSSTSPSPRVNTTQAVHVQPASARKSANIEIPRSALFRRSVARQASPDKSSAGEAPVSVPPPPTETTNPAQEDDDDDESSSDDDADDDDDDDGVE
jgi:hypothetical protein